MDEKGRQEGYGRFLDKKIAIFYQDSENHVGRKDGVCVSVDNDCITLLSYGLEILIPKDKIVRVEFRNGD